MDAEAAFWEERGEGAAATLGKFAKDWGSAHKWSGKPLTPQPVVLEAL